MKHEDKIKYMQDWCNENNLDLILQGECGLGRDCVGILSPLAMAYPDYILFDEEYNVIFGEEVWTPEDAYHKHPCVAVLGLGEKAECQLYEWVKWFNDNGYICITKPSDKGFDIFSCGYVSYMTKV